MTALKDLRHDLGAHLATGLGVAHSRLGAQLNPPALQVTSGTPYVARQDYSTDLILWSVTIVTKAGDLAAVADVLDDYVDKVRATLLAESPGGHMFSFQEVSPIVAVSVGDTDVPGVVVTVAYERPSPRA